LSNSSGKLGEVDIFSSPVKTLAHGFSIGDINNDGYTDIVVNNLSSNVSDVFVRSNFVFLNDGLGNFTEVSEIVLPFGLRYSNPEAASHDWSGLVDLNNDQHLDLILGTWEGSDWRKDPAEVKSVFVLNDGTGNFSNSPIYELPKTPLFRENILDIDGFDINGDGYQDLVISSTNGGDMNEFYRKGYIQILINNRDNTFTDETNLRLPQDPNADGPWWKFVKPADFNNDGAMDLFLVGAGPVAYEQNISARLLLNDGQGNFTKEFDLPVNIGGPDAIDIFDVNNDGRLDIVYLRQDTESTSSLYALLNDLKVPTYEDAINNNRDTASGLASAYEMLLGGVPNQEGFKFLISSAVSTNFGAGPGVVFNQENIFINLVNNLVQGNADAKARFDVLATGTTLQEKVASLYSAIIPAAMQSDEGLSFITRAEGLQFYQDVAAERGVAGTDGAAIVSLASLLKIAVTGDFGIGNAVNDLIKAVAAGNAAIPTSGTTLTPLETADGTAFDGDDATAMARVVASADTPEDYASASDLTDLAYAPSVSIVGYSDGHEWSHF
tara:strand:+ start:1552 stop:3210 length:1659 start_codon:yes stop_codon:yes gene_type:complete